MAFWSDVNSNSVDPKRNFRFKVTITSIDGSIWYAKTCDKPSFTIETTEHQYLNHTFYYPGAVKWQTVSMQLVDPAKPDAVATVASIIQQSGYKVPATAQDLGTMTKASAVGALGDVIIQQLNGKGDAIESWTLRSAFITEAKFGSLEYGSDDLTTLDLTLQYDWATCVVTTDNGGSIHVDSVGAHTFFDKAGTTPA
jgi:hypothetical protein